jgi:aminopeptidase-like protein
MLAHFANRMRGINTRYSYRFLFAPGTIGAITWLARNEDKCRRIKHGLVISMVGDGGGPTYKKSRRGNAKIDRAVTHVLRHAC